MQLGPILLALLSGACMPTQAGINWQLARWTRDPVSAAFISFFVGTAALFVLCLARRVPWPEISTISQTQPWHWVGGFLGALVVSASIVLAPRLGASTLMALLVAGQLLTSLVLDHFGLVGYEIRSASLLRLLGVCLLIAGVVLIRKY